MAYNDAVDTMQALLIAAGYIESKETITLDELPSTISHKAFSITLDSIEMGTYETQDRFFPIEKIKISAIYFIGNNSFAKYENAISWNEDIISLIMNPDNFNVSVRNVSFAGSTTSTKQDESKNYLIIENIFNVEVTLLYIPDLSNNVQTDTVTGATYTALVRSGTVSLVADVSKAVTFSSALTGTVNVVAIRCYDSGGANVEVTISGTSTTGFTATSPVDATLIYLAVKEV